MSARRSRMFTDARFVIGIVLVLGSIAGVWGVVSATNRTSSAVTATRVLVPGEEIKQDDLAVVDVALGEHTKTYAADAEALVGKSVARVVGKGELVPVDAIAGDEDADSTSIVVSVASAPAANVVTGRTVELWATPARNDESEARPHILVAGAVVAALAADEGMMARAVSVELIVPRASVADILQAQAHGDVLAVVPAGAAK